jgi:pimeloyl-ACP methyl ester carboxylesterase
MHHTMGLERLLHRPEKRITARHVRRYRNGAVALQSNTVITDPYERFNAGFRPLAKSGELSLIPGTALENNAADVFTAITNETGVHVHRTRLTNNMRTTPSLTERDRLEAVRDALRVQELKFQEIRVNEYGDYIRKVPKTEKFTDPLTGQVIKFVRYNWEQRQPGETVTVSMPAYNTRTDKNTSASVRDAELAAQMPDRPMIAIMHPGMGSGRIKGVLRKDLGTQDSYFGIADAQLRLLKSLGIGSSQADRIDLVGESMGAFAALAVATRAKAHDLTVNRLALSALVGVEERDPKEMGRAMMDSGKYLAPAWVGPFDPYIYNAGLLHRSSLRQLVGTATWGARLILNDPLIHKFPYARAMAEKTATKRLLQVLRDNTNSSVVLIAGTDDLVSRYEAINKTVKQVRESEPTFGSNRLARIVFQGGTHQVMENPLRYAATVKSVLTARYKLPETV